MAEVNLRPVIVISGLADAFMRKRAHAANALMVFDKPYHAEKILKLVRVVAGRG